MSATKSEAVLAEADGRLTLQSGEVIEADLIVGADGVGSKVRVFAGFTAGPLVVHRRNPFAFDRSASFEGQASRRSRVGQHHRHVEFRARVSSASCIRPCQQGRTLSSVSMAPAADPAWLEGARWISRSVVEMFPFLEPCLEEAAKLQLRPATTSMRPPMLDSWVIGGGKVASRRRCRAMPCCPALAQGAGCSRWSTPSAWPRIWPKIPQSKDALVSWKKTSSVRSTDHTQALSGEYAVNRFAVRRATCLPTRPWFKRRAYDHDQARVFSGRRTSNRPSVRPLARAPAARPQVRKK